jgi:hypothetical protein
MLIGKWKVNAQSDLKPIPSNVLLKALDDTSKSDLDMWKRIKQMIHTELVGRKVIGSDVDKLKGGKDFGKYRNPLKEDDTMKLSDRLAKVMVKEEESTTSMESPLQSTGSTPEPAKETKDINAPEKKEEPKTPAPTAEADKKFKEGLQKIMKKVKENQTVEWKELIDLLGVFEKTDFSKD